MSDLRQHPVIASMAVPMDDRADVDYDALRAYDRWLFDEQGLTAVTINADTAEGAHLTNEERLRIAETVREEAGSDRLLVCGLHGTSTRAAVAMAAEYAKVGVDAVLLFGISAYAGQPLPASMVVDYHRAVREAGLPLIGFSLTPELGGTLLTPEMLEGLGHEHLLIGMKDASFDAGKFVASRDAMRLHAPDAAFLSGSDNFVYESFVLGARGCLLGLAGIAGRLTGELLELVATGRIAEAEQLNRERYSPLAEAMFAPAMRDNRARIKEGLKHLGVIPNATVRAPLASLDPADRARMLAAVDLAMG